MRSLLFPFAVTLPAAALAQTAIVSATAVDPMTRDVAVEMLVTNTQATAESYAVAGRLDGELTTPAGVRTSVTLDRASGQAAAIVLPPSGFARVRYHFVLPAGVAPGLVALALPDRPAIALIAPDAPSRIAQGPDGSSPPAARPERPAAEERGRSGFFANLSTYEPIYAVYGPGTNTEARIQISLQYQLFGTPGIRGSWADGLRFGYTQRMFWDLGRDSSPFRDVNYMPELFYVLPQVASAGGWAIGGRLGVQHASNGRSGLASRSINTLYIEPEATTRLGRYDLTVGPRVWAYVGRRSDNPDIARYRGHLGAFARIGRTDGLQLDLTGRINPGSGKGAAEGLVSYPLTGIVASGPKLYLFGQAFAGYGESLLDYNRRQTRLRAGIGITR